METLKKIVLLIDADNTQLSKLEGVIREISAYGRIVVKRAYGNWKKDTLKNWESVLKRLAIKAEQQFDYVPGKNATDIALVIDAVNMIHQDIYDAFVIVSSDSDFTPLAINLHESGVFVIGVGIKETPESFRNSCDEFIYLENIYVKEKSTNSKEKRSGSKNKPEENDTVETGEDGLDEIHSLLKLAFDKYQDDEGYVNISTAGQFIKRVKPDYDIRTYGYAKLPELINAFPEKYEMTKYPGKGTVTIIAYRCKE